MNQLSSERIQQNLLAGMNYLIHGRIGECRIIHFVVTPSTETIQVDENVFSEFSLIIECQLCDSS